MRRYKNASWQRQALCASSLLNFFAQMPDEVEAAKHLCRGCPVIDQCRQLADEIERNAGQTHIVGVWGGESTGDRIKRRRAVA
jgi:hypothetical protein